MDLPRTDLNGGTREPTDYIAELCRHLSVERPLIEVQRRVDGELMSELTTGKMFVADVGSASSAVMLQPESNPGTSWSGKLYIPESYPYTHTHIEELGDWPQRLLHVPTMTSFEWQPGNHYGGHHEPKYRAISYTWGRWRLKDIKDPDTDAMTIHGVPWKVPRVSPEHFTVQQFQHIINRACEPIKAENAISMSANSNLLRGLPAAEFLWLDVACIDQRWGPLAALEVGRQAGIFRRSDAVAIWLSQSGNSSTDYDTLQELFTDVMCRAEQSLYTDQDLDASFLARMLDGLKMLFGDPWYSSLWTLQEAYLSQDAYLLSSGGKAFEINAPIRWAPGVFTLNLLTDACATVAFLCGLTRRSTGATGLTSLFSQIRDVIHKSGLSLLTRNGNPLSLLSAAHFRTTSDPLDRVYGIMQVFRYRLGATSPDSDPARVYTLLELVDQLGEALFQDRMVQSQLHAFTEIVPSFQGWHVNTSSAVPNEYLRDNDWNRCEARCCLSTQKIDGATLGYFRGRICAFAPLAVAWEAVDRQTGRIAHRNHPGRASVVRIFPDASEWLLQRLLEIEESQHSPTPLRRPTRALASGSSIQFLDDPEEQRLFAQWLSQRFARNRLFVLRMGTMAAKTCGLIILHVKVGPVLYWHRIGTCMWWHDSASMDTRGYYEILGGRSDDWADVEGLFG